MENRHTKEDLAIMQALPLDLKVRLTEDRIKAWVNEFGEDGVCVAYSGGKDSTVLLDIVRNLYPGVKAVFSNTGLEYPEIRQFAMSHDNVDIVYPDVRFVDVISQYGYPLIGKEVAEAIYYARRIGGGYTPRRNAKSSILDKKRNELAEWGGVSRSSQSSTSRKPHDNGDGSTPRGGVVQLPEGREKATRTQRVRGSKWADYPRGCLQQPRKVGREVAV